MQAPVHKYIQEIPKPCIHWKSFLQDFLEDDQMNQEDKVYKLQHLYHD